MKPIKKAAYITLSLFVAIMLSGSIYLLYLKVSGNFHEVVAGEYYRSAQPSKGEITKIVSSHQIKSVINLRGAHKGAAWYEEEKREVAAAGIDLIDFRMSDGEHMSHKEALKLIDVMAKAPKPVLVHCRAGADRTGLASALYLAAVKKDTEFNAEMQMTAIYGHLSLWFTRPYAMNTTFEDMEPLLGYYDS